MQSGLTSNSRSCLNLQNARITGIHYHAQLKTSFFKEKIHRVGGMAQVVVHLPNKLKALNSNPRRKKEKLC
jgi:hypothetical protein